jgi:hypothetical protein
MEVEVTMVAVVEGADGMAVGVEMVKEQVEEEVVMRLLFSEALSLSMETTAARTEGIHRWLEMNHLAIGKHPMGEQGKMVWLLLSIKFLLVEKKWPSWLK